MTRRTGRFGTDYTDPSSYSGTGWGLEESHRGHPVDRGPVGMMLRTAGAVTLAVVALVVFFHVIGFVLGTVFLVLRLALLAGLVALGVAAFRRFR